MILKKLKPLQMVKSETRCKKAVAKLPPDVYSPEFEPIRIFIREYTSKSGSLVKQYLDVFVKRFDDELGLPYVWVQMYQEAESYTGYLKGKTIYLPLDMLIDFIDSLDTIAEECEKRGIE